MHFHLVPIDATTARASDVIGVLEEVFAKYGAMPRKGVIVSESVWYSSQEIAEDPDTAPRAADLKAFGIEFPAIIESDRAELLLWSTNRGFHCSFPATRFLLRQHST
jgi:hypothetical protein